MDLNRVGVYMVRPNSTNDFSIVGKHFTIRLDELWQFIDIYVIID